MEGQHLGGTAVSAAAALIASGRLMLPFGLRKPLFFMNWPIIGPFFSCSCLETLSIDGLCTGTWAKATGSTGMADLASFLVTLFTEPLLWSCRIRFTRGLLATCLAWIGHATLSIKTSVELSALSHGVPTKGRGSPGVLWACA